MFQILIQERTSLYTEEGRCTKIDIWKETLKRTEVCTLFSRVFCTKGEDDEVNLKSNLQVTETQVKLETGSEKYGTSASKK